MSDTSPAFQSKFPSIIKAETLKKVTRITDGIQLLTTCLDMEQKQQQLKYVGRCSKCNKDASNQIEPLGSLKECTADHFFCTKCSKGTKNSKSCPLCVTAEQLQQKMILPETAKTLEESTKFIKVKELLAAEPNTSFAIFSKFNTSLQLLRCYLKQNQSWIQAAAGREIFLFNGAVGQKEREQIIEKAAITRCIMLVTIQTAGVGLNLTFLQRAILLEPNWNPFVEMQARDRLHRFGQTQPTTWFKIYASKSVEQSVFTVARIKEDNARLELETATNKVTERPDTETLYQLMQNLQ